MTDHGAQSARYKFGEEHAGHLAKRESNFQESYRLPECCTQERDEVFGEDF